MLVTSCGSGAAATTGERTGKERGMATMFGAAGTAVSVNKGASGTLGQITGKLVFGPNLNEISDKCDHDDGGNELTEYFESTVSRVESVTWLDIYWISYHRHQNC